MRKIALIIILFISTVSSFGQSPPKKYFRLIEKAKHFYAIKDYKESALVYSMAFQVNGWKALSEHRYNAACSWALASVPDSAFFQLTIIATKAAYTNYEEIATDTDFVSLHADKRWNPLLEKIKQNQKSANKLSITRSDTLSAIDALYKESQLKTEELKKEQSKLENYYAPFHETIKDTVYTTISRIGIYLSAGVGLSNDYGIVGAAVPLNCSFAYKSHLFTITSGNGGNYAYGGRDGGSFQQTNYVGFLYGESIRCKNSLLALSVGVALSNVYVNTYVLASMPNNANYNKQGIVSVPIEFKYFWLANNGIGFGIHVSENIISEAEFSSFYIGGCVVFGIWNNPKKTEHKHWDNFINEQKDFYHIK